VRRRGLLSVGLASEGTLNFFDLHIDTLKGIASFEAFAAGLRERQVDLPRLASAGGAGAVAAVFVRPEEDPEIGLRQIRSVLSILMAGGQGDDRRLLDQRDVAGLHRVLEAGGPRTASGIRFLAGVEGAHGFGADLEVLLELQAAGLRLLTLTWNNDNPWAAGCSSEGPSDTGLTDAGREALGVCEEVGVVVDLAHASPRTLTDALDVVRKPFFVSHTACRALCDHRRNLDDGLLKAVAEAGGVIGMTLVPAFLAEDEESVDIDVFCDHVLHAVATAGLKAVGLGTDLDGTARLPRPMAGVEDIPLLFQRLRQRGLGDRELQLIGWRNALRVLAGALPGKKRSVGEARGPSNEQDPR